MKKAKRPNKNKVDIPDIISEKEFKDHLKALGFSDADCDDAIRSALKQGLFSLVAEREGAPCYRVASYDEMEKIAGCKHVGSRVEIPIVIIDRGE